MTETKSDLTLKNIKVLQEKTGISMYLCKQALNKSEYNIDEAILFLRNNKIIQFISKEELIKKCSDYTLNWAEEFLTTTLDTGELQKYYESGEIQIIRDNFFDFYIIGNAETCPFIIFEKELKLLTKNENNEFEYEIEILYQEAVDQLLPNYIQPNWKSPG